MRVGLFIPCYMDAFEPEVGVATLELLERLGCSVEYPVDQTCCGQPMTNTGCHKDAVGAEELFVKNFSGYDFIVAPSGSCVHQVRVNMTAIEQTPQVRAVRERTFELTEFIHDILKVSEFPWARFPSQDRPALQLQLVARHQPREPQRNQGSSLLKAAGAPGEGAGRGVRRAGALG
jgi:L-lactate dehydrogenase complex protein LldE